MTSLITQRPKEAITVKNRVNEPNEFRTTPPAAEGIPAMSDSEKPATPAAEEKKPASTAEADLTKYKVGDNIILEFGT